MSIHRSLPPVMHRHRRLLALTCATRQRASSRTLCELSITRHFEMTKGEYNHLCSRCGCTIKAGETGVTCHSIVETPTTDTTLDILESSAGSTHCNLYVLLLPCQPRCAHVDSHSVICFPVFCDHHRLFLLRLPLPILSVLTKGTLADLSRCVSMCHSVTKHLVEATMQIKQVTDQLPTEWLTVDEAASYLRVSRRTIYRWSEAGRLPAYVIGDYRNRRYRRTDLDSVPRRAARSED